MLDIFAKMEWPFAFAIVGVAWAISIPLIARRTMQNAERIEEIKLKRAMQLEAFKKGSLTYIEENE